MKVGLVQKLLSVLNKVLEKLGRYDEGTMMGGFLGMMVRKTTSKVCLNHLNDKKRNSVLKHFLSFFCRTKKVLPAPGSMKEKNMYPLFVAIWIK